MAVEIFTSSVGGNLKLNKETSSIKFLLEAHKIAYVEVDLALTENEGKKKKMLEVCGSRVMPKIFVDGQYKGDCEGLVEANEDGLIRQYLGLQ